MPFTPTHSLLHPHGVVILTDPEFPHEVHADTLKCAHCQRIMIYRRGAGRSLHYCASCNGHTCDLPQCTGECRHWEKALDLYEAGKIASL